MIFKILPCYDADSGQPVCAFLNNQMVFEDFHVFEQNILPVRYNLLPAGFTGVVYRGAHKPEIPGIQVGFDVKMITVMIEVVLMIAFPGLDNAETATGVISTQNTIFGRDRTERANAHVGPRFRSINIGYEGFVIFLVDQL